MSEEEKKAIKMCKLLLEGDIQLHCIDNDGGTSYDGIVNKQYNKDLEIVLNLIDKLQRQIKIKDNYFDMIYFVGADYDGYEKAKDLKSVIDDLVDYAIKGKNNDDKSQMYINGSGKPENILFEEIKESK